MFLGLEMLVSPSMAEITPSTISREKLPKGAVVETDYYTDNLNWIKNTTELKKGMKYFYQKTGVQPYIYIDDNLNGFHSPTDEQFDLFGNQLYESLFKDEAHFLLFFIEYDSEYTMWYIGGKQAKTVMNEEASNILMDYIERYYYNATLTEDKMFSKAFSSAADRIMKKTVPFSVYLISGIGVIITLFIACKWWGKAKKHKLKEKELDKQILQTPIEKIGDESLKDLEHKYLNNNGGK